MENIEIAVVSYLQKIKHCNSAEKIYSKFHFYIPEEN